MTGKKIIYYILAAFIAGNLLLIYIEFNSAKNISTLISGNEKLLEEFKVSSELKELETDISSLENKTSRAVIRKDSSGINEFEDKIAEVENDLKQLQKINDDDTTVKYVDKLDDLVQRKLFFNRQLLDAYYKSGKNPAENLLIAQQEKDLTDSIKATAEIIDSSRRKLLSDVTLSIDKSGKNAQQFSISLIILVVISGAGLFWYIINIIRKQTQLIGQLNVSEKKVKDAAELKEKFMANMSHEIRTPMNAILGFTNLLQRKNIDSESKGYVQTIQKSGESLLTIINDILDLSKIEAGMMRIEAAPFSIRSLVHSIEMMFKIKTDEKQLQLLVTVDESLPDGLEGDATRLTQILVNLIGNALKFTSKGSIAIKLTNEGCTEKIIKTGIEISDTGIGIEKDKVATIFERFQQAEDSVTRRYGGTGLGLAIVNDLLLLQDGTITVESEAGKGTTFRIIIPYKIAAEQSRLAMPVEISTAIQYDFVNVCVLVVEDNEINRSLLYHLFNSWQLKFDLVNNGREAIDILQTKNYNLILMDIQMPEMDGYTATQEIRGKLQLNTPIIAMTAHAMAGEREKCLSYGMNEYISKPIREGQLHKLIAQFTNIVTPKPLVNKQIIIADTSQYKYINLQYMKEVSNGNTDYERTVTEQFIEAIPVDLTEIENAWQRNEITQMRQLAHNLKTTVSVMGLNELLQPSLDALEYKKLGKEKFSTIFLQLKTICEASVEEAKQFYANF